MFCASFAFWLVVGPDAADVFFPAGFAAFGFLGGVLFQALLRACEGRHRFEAMSLRRASGWGAASGLLLSGIFAPVAALAGENAPLEHLAFLGPVFALFGSLLAGGMLMLARRSP